MAEFIQISNRSKYPGYIRLVAEKGQEAVGISIGLQVGKTMLLENFRVEPTLRKMGIGATLLTETEKAAKESGAKRILRIGMFCDADSIPAYINAVKFFIKNGYSWSIIALSKSI